MEVAPFFLKKGKTVIDLSADYRLEEPKIYTKWYGTLHKDKKNILKAIYGLPELYRSKISKAKLIANPGCYPTSVILACAPVIKEDLVRVDNIIADAKSGVTGAGRGTAPQLLFGEVNDDLKAYKINEHQHQPEIDQELSKLAGKKIEITFVPHLIPINRGILSTIYFEVKKATTVNKIYKLYQDFYQREPFVRILPLGTFPQVKEVAYTNYCDIGLKFNEEKKRLIVISAIDNLVKGASGQAVQNMNIIYGFKETIGLI
jgi:N-acetyl-gamma-glutamyl-phosphate reductase